MQAVEKCLLTYFFFSVLPVRPQLVTLLDLALIKEAITHVLPVSSHPKPTARLFGAQSKVEYDAYSTM